MNEMQPSTNRIKVISPGAGLEASYFAAALARELVAAPVAEEVQVALIDGLRGCGGLDLVLDLETQDGVRWPSLRGARGHVDVDMLLASLPIRDGVAVLSHSSTSAVTCTSEVTQLVGDAISSKVTWCVETGQEDATPSRDEKVLLVVHGSLCGLAAAHMYLYGVPRDLTVGIVLVETPAAQRAMVEEALGVPVVAHAPTRWHMAPVAIRNVMNGNWPHTGDRAFAALVKDSAIYVRSEGRCLVWA